MWGPPGWSRMQRGKRDGPCPRLISTRGRMNRSNLECFRRGSSGGSKGRDKWHNGSRGSGSGGRGPHARPIGRDVPTSGFSHFRNRRGLEKMGRVCYRKEIHGEEEWMK